MQYNDQFLKYPLHRSGLWEEDWKMTEAPRKGQGGKMDIRILKEKVQKLGNDSVHKLTIPQHSSNV